MSRLPAHHVARPRLTSLCRDTNVVLLEAAGGYGKSILAAELADAWGAVAVDVLLEEGPVQPDLFVSRLRSAVARAGFSDAASSTASSEGDLVGGLDALISALGPEACALLIDDAHNCDRGTGLLIDRITSQLTPSLRLLIACRFVPAGIEKARRAPAVLLRANDLALRPDETLKLCREGFGLGVTAEVAKKLDEATAGWTAATVLAASRSKSTGEGLNEVAMITDSRNSSDDVFDSLLHEAVTSTGLTDGVLAAIGRLPFVNHEILDAIAGEGFFDRALSVGLPFTPQRDRWWTLPGPVRDFLAGLADADSGALQRAAIVYESRGEVGTGLQLLVSAGQPELAAELLARADPSEVDALDISELLAVVDRLPAETLVRHPRALLHTALACDLAQKLSKREELMSLLETTVSKVRDPALRRAVEAERASDRIRDVSAYREAEQMGKEILDEAPAAESLTRARALSVVGRAGCWHRDVNGRIDENALHRAASDLEEAHDIFVALGLKQLAAGMAPPRAIWVELTLGRSDRACEILTQAIELLVDRPRQMAWVLQFRAEVLAEMARHEESEADITELFRIGEQLGNPPQLIAYCYWNLMVSSSYRGDARSILANARLVESHRDEWWEFAGQDFLAAAADNLDRVGYTSVAWEFLNRAHAQPGDADTGVALAECALMARHGDPVAAEGRLRRVTELGIQVREYWRVTLLRAYAAFRRGDSAAGPLAARAFEEAASLGQSTLPLVRERDLTESVIGLAAQTGMPAAIELESSTLPLTLRLLGAFELAAGGRPVPLATGQASQLLKLVAVSGGRIPAERAIEALWPETDPDAGRNRLRTVLNRLKESAPDAVSREGELLVLSPAIRLDLSQFEAEARQALALGSVESTPALALARSAIARYRGDLLSGDPYAEWAELPRDQARRTMLELLDLCAEIAADRGDLDELRRVVVRTIELAPHDDARYMKAASVLLEQGRRGAALAIVRRAQAALSELGLEPPLQLVRLERDLVA